MSARSAVGTLGLELVRIAFGSACVVCESELPICRRVASCCVDCWSRLPRIEEARCLRCALPMPDLDDPERPTCLRCRTKPLDVPWIDSWGRYDSGLTKVLHAFKFARHEFLSDPLSDLLASVCHARSDIEFDIVSSVPMFPAKERKRGFNQADLLGRGLARRISLPYEGRLLRKTEERETQADLKKDARRANVKGTFSASRDTRGLRILLVDDICTTGETLSACARELVDAGASGVAAVTVARTP